MRLTANLAGLFLCAGVFISYPSQASALASAQISFSQATNMTGRPMLLAELSSQQPDKTLDTAAKPLEHTVAPGETLTIIANKHETTWQRLYAKNIQIEHPDIINVNQALTIPPASEQLAERSLQQTSTAIKFANKTSSPTIKPGSSAGNKYTAGYCTWYAKNKRPDLPNNLGNANTWVARAQAQGLPTGAVPRAGAIGQKGMHVVYVERVHADGTIFVSEMNHVGFNVVSTRTVPANYFYYIY